MIKDNSYFYTIQEIIINRKSDALKINKQPFHYLQLIIKHRLQNTTLVVFTKSIPIDDPDAFEKLLDLAKQMRELY